MELDQPNHSILTTTILCCEKLISFACASTSTVPARCFDFEKSVILYTFGRLQMVVINYFCMAFAILSVLICTSLSSFIHAKSFCTFYIDRLRDFRKHKQIDSVAVYKFIVGLGTCVCVYRTAGWDER